MSDPVDHVTSLTDEEVDEGLRAAGVDPDEGARLAQAAIRRALDEAAVMPGSGRGRDIAMGMAARPGAAPVAWWMVIAVVVATVGLVAAIAGWWPAARP